MRTRTVRGLARISALLLAYLCPSPATAEPPSHPTPTGIIDLFSKGDAGYPVFRIPSLVATKNNVLLAFAEARSPDTPEQHDDHARNDIVLRRSLDAGATWEPIRTVADRGGDSLNDPCAVALPDSGRVLLMYQRFPQGFHARKMEHTEMAEPGYDGPRNTQTFLVFSDDSGATWSAPKDITRSVRSDDAISVGSPGVGIVLKRGQHPGRILFPLYEVIFLGDGEERYWRNRVAISDDGGENWRLGERVPIDGLVGFGNECQLAEMADGTIRMNARLQTGANRIAWSISRDGGETWAPMQEDPGLVTTPCMASLAAYPSGATGEIALLASLPNSEKDRENGTLFISRDGGKTWPDRHTIYAGGFAYSCLAVLPGGRIGCLFERGPYDHVSFVSLDISPRGQEGTESP